MDRILLVDDQDEVRDVVSLYLANFGYAVHEVSSSVEALRHLTENGDYVAAVIDVTMPDKDGWTLLSELRRSRPDLPVVMMSGYSEADADEKTADDPNAVFIAKPFGREHLQESLSQVLGGNSG